jgi:thiol-disulfide isomerase/thioredoxin
VHEAAAPFPGPATDLARPAGRRRSSTLSRRALLLQGAAAATSLVVPCVRAQADSGAGAALAAWRPSKRPRLDAVDLLSGQRRTLADFAGQALVVNFWATWCAPCRIEMPSLNAAATRLKDRGLHLVAINHGEMPERVQGFLNEFPIAGTVLLDRSQTQLKAWGGQALPATFMIDASGRPRLWAQGERDWGTASLSAALESLLAR